MNTEDSSISEGTVYYDIRFRVISPEDGGESDKNYGGIIKMLDVLLSEHVSPEEKKKVLHVYCDSF